MKILVIEDDAKTASLMHKGLSQEGFIVDTCSNGEDGLELAMSSPARSDGARCYAAETGWLGSSQANSPARYGDADLDADRARFR